MCPGKSGTNVIRIRKIVIAVLVAAAIFYPHPWRVGGLEGGPIAPGQTAYVEQYSCVGFKLTWSSLSCADCAGLYPCFGILFHKTCAIEEYDLNKGFTSTPVACR